TVTNLEKSIQKSYEKRGYRSVRVDVQVREDAKAGGVHITVDLQEGRATRIAGIVFAGKPLFSAPDLLIQLRLSGGEVLERERLQNGVDNLMRFYRSKSYYEVVIKTPDVKLMPSGDANVSFTIQPGPRIDIEFVGAQGFSRKQFLTALK